MQWGATDCLLLRGDPCQNDAVPDLVPLRDAAQEFGLDPATLYRAIRRGSLKRWTRELDPKTYVDRDAIRRLLELRPAP